MTPYRKDAQFTQRSMKRDYHQCWRLSPCSQQILFCALSFPLHFPLACLSAASFLPALKIHNIWQLLVCLSIHFIRTSVIISAPVSEQNTCRDYNAKRPVLFQFHKYLLWQHHSFLVRFGNFSLQLLITDITRIVCALWVEDNVDIMRSSSAPHISVHPL